MPLNRRKTLQLLALSGGWHAVRSSASRSQTMPDQAAQPAAQSKAPAADAGLPAERVVGIGGLFFRAHDPKSLAEWYRVHLGVVPTPTSEGQPSWHTEAGTTVFAPFPQTTRYFGEQTQGWMVNFRVRDLDRMTAQLRSAGITVSVDAERYPNGRFARIHDPEGNPIELWEPAAS